MRDRYKHGYKMVTNNGSPYATATMFCLSVTLVYCGGDQMVG